ncbi:hypothetical protein PITC_003800 [Penicillium italicum]|uniref:Uncharacterized protein n=1 Tax=Penicillium italicum TaxID=40296 RepID=A0A0A2LAF7_PENIT|nr:hypothetical protein PITC_003800 [Penicillium italicum]
MSGQVIGWFFTGVGHQALPIGFSGSLLLDDIS